MIIQQSLATYFWLQAWSKTESFQERNIEKTQPKKFSFGNSDPCWSVAHDISELRRSQKSSSYVGLWPGRERERVWVVISIGSLEGIATSNLPRDLQRWSHNMPQLYTTIQFIQVISKAWGMLLGDAAWCDAQENALRLGIFAIQMSCLGQLCVCARETNTVLMVLDRTGHCNPLHIQIHYPHLPTTPTVCPVSRYFFFDHSTNTTWCCACVGVDGRRASQRT